MNVSLCDLCSLACSTSSIIFETVLSPKSFVVRTLITPERLTHPDITSSPTVSSRGIDSPVSAMVLSDEVPSITTPSNGTFSPGRMIMTEPISTSSGGIFFSVEWSVEFASVAPSAHSSWAVANSPFSVLHSTFA